MLIQVEAPRLLEGRRARLAIAGRSANELIIMSNRPSDLVLELTEERAQVLASVELGDEDTAPTPREMRQEIRIETTINTNDQARIDQINAELDKNNARKRLAEIGEAAQEQQMKEISQQEGDLMPGEQNMVATVG